jgi:hypothetical protein
MSVNLGAQAATYFRGDWELKSLRASQTRNPANSLSDRARELLNNR